VITIDGQDQSPSALALGMMATVRGRVAADAVAATEIQIEHLVRGSVTGQTTGWLFVGTQAVQLSVGTVVASALGDANAIPIGMRVRVFGQGTDDGAVLASRVDDDPGHEAEAEFELELKGFVSALSTDKTAFDLSLSLGADASYHVTLAAGVLLPEGLLEGSWVEVRALEMPVAGQLIAAAVTLKDDFLGHEPEGEHEGHPEQETEHGVEVEVEGYVTSGDAQRFVLAGQTVVTTATTVYVGGSAAEILSGAKLSAEGTLGSDQVLVAMQIKFHEFVRLQAPVTNLLVEGEQQGSFMLLGLTVFVNDTTELRDGLSLATLSEGWVEVRGFLAGNGSDIIAVQVGMANDARLFIESVVTAKDDGAHTLVMLGITVALAPVVTDNQGEKRGGGSDDGTSEMAALFPLIEVGKTIVKARGADASSFVSGTLYANELELEELDNQE